MVDSFSHWMIGAATTLIIISKKSGKTTFELNECVVAAKVNLRVSNAINLGKVTSLRRRKRQLELKLCTRKNQDSHQAT